MIRRDSHKFYTNYGIVVLVCLFFFFTRSSREMVCRNLWAVDLLKGKGRSCIDADKNIDHLALFASIQSNSSKMKASLLAEADSKHPLVIATLGELYIQDGLYDETINLWREHKNIWGLSKAASDLFDEGNYDVAMHFAQARLSLGDLNSADWEIYLLMIQVELETSQDIDTILRLAAEGVALNPRARNLYLYPARFFWEKGDYDISTIVYEAGRQRFPTESAIWLGLGRNAWLSGRYDEMCPFFEQAVSLNYSQFACERINELCRETVSSMAYAHCQE